MKTILKCRMLAVALVLMWSHPLWAGLNISGSAGVVSEDRYRGVSLTDKQPAVQASLTLEKHGFYLSTFLTPDKAFGGTEIDVSGGYSRKFGAVTADVGLLGYLFPDGGSLHLGPLDYVEIYGSAAKTFGPVTTKLGINYVPKQDNVRNGSLKPPVHDNLYVYANFSGAVPATPLSLSFTIGREAGAFSYVKAGSKIDWTLSLSGVFRGFTGSVSYIGNTAPVYLSDTGSNLTGHTIVIGLVKYF